MDTKATSETEAVQTTESKIVMDVQHITKSLPLGHEHIEILKGIDFQIMSGEFVDGKIAELDHSQGVITQ